MSKTDSWEWLTGGSGLTTGLEFKGHKKGSGLGGVVRTDKTHTESVAVFGESVILVVAQRTLGGHLHHEGRGKMTTLGLSWREGCLDIGRG